MYDVNKIKQEEREVFLLKIIEWAQKHNRKVESLTRDEILTASRCKL